LNNLGDEGAWTWADDTEVTYMNWIEPEPEVEEVVEEATEETIEEES